MYNFNVTRIVYKLSQKSSFLIRVNPKNFSSFFRKSDEKGGEEGKKRKNEKEEESRRKRKKVLLDNWKRKEEDWRIEEKRVTLQPIPNNNKRL